MPTAPHLSGTATVDAAAAHVEQRVERRRGRPARAARLVRAATMWGAIGAGTWLLTFGVPVDRVDETWFLQVVHRLLDGDAPYRDVYVVTTPLALWIAAPFAAAFGDGVMTMRALGALTIVAALAVSGSIMRAVGARRGATAVLCLVVFALASPLGLFSGLYTKLATLGGLLALRALLAWQVVPRAPRTRVWALVASGASCGLVIGTKPNVGTLVVFATVVGIVSTVTASRRARMRATITVGVVTVGVVAVVFAPVVVAGHWSSFYDQVVGTKGNYARVGFSYFEALGRNWRMVRIANAPLVERALAVVELLPIVALGWFVTLGLRGGWTHRTITFAAFAGAGLAGTWPRPGTHHLASAAPLVITAMAAAAVGSTRKVRASMPSRIALAGLGAWGAITVVLLAGIAIDNLGSGRYTREGLAHVSPAPAVVKVPDRVHALQHALRARGIDRIFIVREDAGFWYLATGARNPLPYDIAERSDLGGDDEAGVIRLLHRGAARYACLLPQRQHPKQDDPLHPARIDHWVRRHWTPLEATKTCDLYERP